MWLGGKNFGATQKQSTETEPQEVNEEEDSRFKAAGLNTGFKPMFGLKTANHGSDNL